MHTVIYCSYCTFCAWETISIQHNTLSHRVIWMCQVKGHGRLKEEGKPMSVTDRVVVEKNTCGWTFKVKQNSPQIWGKKARGGATDVMVSQSRQCPGRGFYSLAEESEWVRQAFTHNLSGTQEINECALLLELSPTHKHHWFSFTSRPVNWFISPHCLKCGNLDKWQKVQRGHVL